MTIYVGTRGSKLAWTQTGHALDLLSATPGGTNQSFERIAVETKGDKDQHTPLATLSGTGLFTKELEAALLEGTVRIAIHSLKDVPFETAQGCALGFLERENPADALLSPHGSFDRLPPGALVGTGSPRRIAQLKAIRPDLRFADLRGNLDTRLRKLDEGNFDAIILAAAGLERLGWAHRISQYLGGDTCVPAFGQGVLCAEYRVDDLEAAEIVKQASDPVVSQCALAERSIMKGLGGGCKTALAAWVRFVDQKWMVDAVAGDHVAGKVVRATWSGDEAPQEQTLAWVVEDVREKASRAGIVIA